MNVNPCGIRKYKTKENADEFVGKGEENISKTAEMQHTNIQGIYNPAMGDKMLNEKIVN